MSPVLTAPTPVKGFMLKDSTEPYSFQPFTNSDENFSTCGFSEYIIKVKTNDDPEAFSVLLNPNEAVKDIKCTSVNQCLER